MLDWAVASVATRKNREFAREVEHGYTSHSQVLSSKLVNDYGNKPVPYNI